MLQNVDAYVLHTQTALATDVKLVFRFGDF